MTDSTHATLAAVHAHLKTFLARDIPAMLGKIAREGWGSYQP